MHNPRHYYNIYPVIQQQVLENIEIIWNKKNVSHNKMINDIAK